MPDGAGSTLPGRVAGLIERHGPIGVDALLELALYDPLHGFYAGGGGRAGRRHGQFLTSPEVGPLFGTVLARALDQWWDDLGRPDPYVVIEAGAGPGTLARAIRSASPRCRSALTYVLVERSAPQRLLHADHLELSDPSHALPAVRDDELTEGGSGPRWTSLGELPAVAVRGVVVANELIDNLPFRLLERHSDGWLEVRLGASGDGLHEVLVPADPADAALARRLAPDAGVGSRLPIQAAAAAWLHGALALLDAGRVLVLDYADRTAALADRPWRDWVRTYRGHQRGSGPFEDLGAQDVTCEVAVDQLARVRPPDLDRSQSEMLVAHGIHELVEDGRRRWNERAHVGDLEAMAARSRIREAEALLDPSGLGGFRALEWVVV